MGLADEDFYAPVSSESRISMVPRASIPVRAAAPGEGSVGALRQLHEALEHAVEGIARLDVDCNYTYVNRPFAAALGYDAEELVGKSWQVTVYSADRPKLFVAYQRMLVDGKAESEVRVLGKDGSVRHQQLTLVAIYDGEETLAGHYTFAKDVTQRVSTRERSLQQTRAFRAMLGSIHDGVLVSDENGSLVYSNPTAERILGVDSAPQSIDRWTERYGVFDPDGVTPIPNDDLPLVRALRGEETANLELFVRNANIPEGMHISASASPIRREDGTFQGGVVVFHDITARRMADLALRRTNRELNDFAYVVSHDLKAPLRGIGSLASFIAEDYADKFDDAGREQMRLLLARVKRMNELIDGILAYSRVGRVREEGGWVELDRLVPDVADLLAPPSHITIDIAEGLPRVSGSETGLQQVFQNLLSNAVKFCDKPQGRVDVDWVEEHDHYRFAVSDNGPGIESRHFERIFQMFQTLSTRDTVESTGIGLSLVKKIVELHGGSVWVESELGLGSSFFFTVAK